MTMSVNMRAAYKKAEEIDKALLGTDPRFNHWVMIRMEDGSSFTINSGFAERHDDYWYVFCEHYQLMVFAADEVNDVSEFKMVSTDYCPVHFASDVVK